MRTCVQQPMGVMTRPTQHGSPTTETSIFHGVLATAMGGMKSKLLLPFVRLIATTMQQQFKRFGLFTLQVGPCAPVYSRPLV
jgi:hypothetical protein